MGFLRRLLGSRDESISIRTESTPTGIRISAIGDVPATKPRQSKPGKAAPPLAGNFVAPELPRFVEPAMLPKAERPYRSTGCPYCGVELSPPPKVKKACPSCRGAILVRSGQDGWITLLRELDLDAWTQADNQQRSDTFERRDTEERAAMKAAGFLVSESGWSVEVVGESHYQPALERIAGGRKDHGSNFQCVARLIREPSNPRDRNAVRVDIQGETVGYVSRDEAEDVQPLLQMLDAQGRPAWIRATIVGGWEREGSRGSFGVELDDLPDEDEV